MRDFEIEPVFVGNSKGVLKIAGRRKGLKNLYDSDKWEQPHWNRSTERSWKNQRKNQYRD